MFATQIFGAMMYKNLDDLKKHEALLKRAGQQQGPVALFAQEALRFLSVAGTMAGSFQLNINSSFEETRITHVLIRSLLEGFFKILYVFDNNNDEPARFKELTDNFRDSYRKLLNEREMYQHLSSLPAAQQSWKLQIKAKTMLDILKYIQIPSGGNLSYAYYVYRLTSFDVHGTTLPAYLDDSWGGGQTHNFPKLDVQKIVEVIAGEYLNLVSDLQKRSRL